MRTSPSTPFEVWFKKNREVAHEWMANLEYFEDLHIIFRIVKDERLDFIFYGPFHGWASGIPCWWLTMVCCAASQKPSRVFMPNLASSSEIVNFKLCQQQSNWCCSGWSYIVFSYRECTTTFWTTMLEKIINIKLSHHFFLFGRLPISSTNPTNLFGHNFTLLVKFFFSEVQSGYRTWFFGVFLYALWILVRSPGWLTRRRRRNLGFPLPKPWIKSHHLGPNKTAIEKLGCFNWMPPNHYMKKMVGHHHFHPFKSGCLEFHTHFSRVLLAD